MILEQLLEKKDLMIYLELRLMELEDYKRLVPGCFPEHRREKIIARCEAKIKELKLLKRIVWHNELRNKCKEKWSVYGEKADND
jgi:hypothetical protein